MATLSNLLLVTASKVGLDNSGTIGSTPTSEQTLMVGWANEGVVDVLIKTRCYIVSGSPVSFVAGTQDYQLPSSLLAINDVYTTSSGLDYLIERVPWSELLAMRRAQVATGTPTRFYSENGMNLLGVFPAPSAGDTMTMYYTPRPTALVNGTDDPSSTSLGGIPTEWHKAIEYYMLWQAGDYSDDASSQNGLGYKQLYEEELVKFRKYEQQKGGRRKFRYRVSAIQRRYIPPYNSIDVR